MSRVIRVLIYSGSPKWLRETLKGSGVPLNGEREISPGKAIKSIITDVDIGGVMCLICSTYETNNKTLICDQCQAEAKRRAKEAEDAS